MPSLGSRHRHLRMINLTRGTVLGTEIELADTPFRRAKGLLGCSHLDPGGGLLIDPSSGVHTFGMQFPIDVIALDRQLRVYGSWENLRPYRITGLSWKTVCVLELPSGVIRQSGTQSGDQIRIGG